MNELMASANIPEHVFPPPRHTFSYSSTSPSTPSSPTISYFQELATQHLHHLKHQQRNSTTSASDCRRKYTARCLFLDIVTNKLHLHLNQNRDPSNPSAPKQKEGFKLYCDDLRPSNVLINTRTGKISGVIDWEFTYGAPSEFTTVAPWWLLLQSPEDWEDDLHLFLNRYRPRLKLFLEILKKREDVLIAQNQLLEEERLSIYMQRSIENEGEGEEEEGGGEGTGLFWICLAARYSSMFDEVYWGFLDERFFGSFTSLEQRMGLLSEEQRLEMEALAREKMGEWDGSEGKGEEGFVDHYPIDKLLEV
ncbi:uncharacterized protein LDX57_003005 [Aspergillus melleus]|uniref:uncharacterized protein n=1 Tax=Aspergillus melleus TaxID=138277 RepID=UPI001E8DBEDB|nr:uncharacterized protein LDX57_003005 [Aspergillus melleus]KAH8425249.1 hypothetical protein LDX57_003005 [Aspergillus melleus]